MLAITIEEDCNICFEKFTNDKLSACKNKKCKFRMCYNCSNKYYENNQRCPHCNFQVINKKNENNLRHIKFFLKLIILQILAYFFGFLITRKMSFAYIFLNIIVGIGIIYLAVFLIYLLLRLFNYDIILINYLISCL